MFRVNQLQIGCSDNLNIVESVEDCLFVIDLCQFLLPIYIPIVVKFHLLQDRISYFVIFQQFFFRVNSSSGVFLLRVSGSATFFSGCPYYV